MFLQKLLNHFKKEVYPSKLNKQISVGTSFGKKAIFANHIPQSGGEYTFMWTKVIEQLPKSFHPKTCLMLGVAGGTAINVLQKFYPTLKITGIELDPVIIDIALKNNFFKEDKNLKLKIADAINWVKTDRNKYDLIIVDLYVGPLNPPAARQKPFLQNVKKLLTKNGTVLMNCHYNKNKKDDYQNFRYITDKLFSDVDEVFTYPLNKILIFKDIKKS